jgi:tetratricopeptide (TPR) repeat protein
VAKEIATFRELHPGRPVFTAIVEGEPGQCFSPALLAGGVEPLAADLRKEGDGRRLGLLKLVAGLAGVGLDALVQRDASRRVRRVTYVTAAAVTAMLMMALLTAFALNARADADRQRAEAEGLVEFMLTDLREQLRSVGRIDVHSTVNNRALSYYAAQGRLEDLPDDSLERRARVLHAMGEDDQKSGNYAGALARFTEAHAATQAAFERGPNNPAAIYGHGQSEFWLGYVHQLRGEWREAGERYDRYAAAARRLISFDPANRDYMLEMAWGASNRGVVQREGDKDPVAAEKSFKAAIRWFEKAVRAGSRASDHRELANAYGDLADTFHMRQMWREALEARLESRRIVGELLRSDSGNVELAYRLAIAERAIAHEMARIGEPARATPYILSAYEGSDRLVGRDPRNADWLLLRAKIECDLTNRKLAFAHRHDPLLLREKILAGASTLRAQRNPRVAELAPCLRAKQPN